MAQPTALLFQTHFFDRRLARLFERLRRQCPSHFECFVLMHLPPGTRKPGRLGAVPHHFVTTPEIRALPYPRKTAERDWTGRSWEFWGGGIATRCPCTSTTPTRIRRATGSPSTTSASPAIGARSSTPSKGAMRISSAPPSAAGGTTRSG